MSKRSKGSVFENESSVHGHAEQLAAQASSLSHEQLVHEYQSLTEHYARLLGDAKLVTSVSDRLQNKLNKANEQITEQNYKLRETIILLQEARAGKKATTIVLLLAVVLFLVSEAFIEPKIETVVNDWYIGLALKGIIAVMLKPIETLVEKYLYKKSIAAGLEAVNAPDIAPQQ